MTPGRWILAVADDLTGAFEVGAKFAQTGIKAHVTCDAALATRFAPVLVVDTETRHAPSQEAAATVKGVAARWRRHEPWLVYKKTDSTLRGNIAAELKALQEEFPERHLLYVAAYPAMGRTVCGGRLFVDGVPVQQTEFASDALNPVHESDVRTAIGQLPATIADGITDEDIQASATQIANSRTPLLVAGPAAIAGALAHILSGFARKAPAPMPALPRCLVVNGSRSAASAAQVRYAAAQGCLDDGWHLFSYDGDLSGMDRALHLGGQVRDYLNEKPVEAIIVFGGDTAFGVLQALRLSQFHSIGEVLPGVPVSRSASLYCITKAGGFGTPDLLCRMRKRLT